MAREEINELGKLIAQNVRDLSIQNGDMCLTGDNMNNPVIKRWRDLKESGRIDEFAKAIIADCVDDAIFYLLDSIDNGIINISFQASNGKVINLPKDGSGELAGDYVGDGGWIEAYSKERFFDYLSSKK